MCGGYFILNHPIVELFGLGVGIMAQSIPMAGTLSVEIQLTFLSVILQLSHAYRNRQARQIIALTSSSFAWPLAITLCAHGFRRGFIGLRGMFSGRLPEYALAFGAFQIQKTQSSVL